MEMIAKIMFGLIVGAVIFADKIPTAKKQDGKFLLYFIGAVLLIGFLACKGDVA